MEEIPEKAEREWATMIACSYCQQPLTDETDLFGPPTYPLCLDCHSAFLHDNGTDFYRNRAYVARIQIDFGRGCPHCHCAMEVGVADWQVNVKCPECGYEETHLLFNQIDDDWFWQSE